MNHFSDFLPTSITNALDYCATRQSSGFQFFKSKRTMHMSPFIIYWSRTFVKENAKTEVIEKVNILTRHVQMNRYDEAIWLLKYVRFFQNFSLEISQLEQKIAQNRSYYYECHIQNLINCHLKCQEIPYSFKWFLFIILKIRSFLFSRILISSFYFASSQLLFIHTLIQPIFFLDSDPGISSLSKQLALFETTL